MKPYKVSSGGQTVTIQTAKDPFDACVKAIKTLKFKALGLIMSVKRGKEEWFCSTEKACKQAGRWRD